MYVCSWHNIHLVWSVDPMQTQQDEEYARSLASQWEVENPDKS